MENQELRQLILRELPGILEHDPVVQELVLRLARQHFADKAETESRFDRILDELRRDREEQHAQWVGQDAKWAEENSKWADQNSKWADQNAKWVDQNSKWADQNSKWADQNSKWAEENVKWADQNSKWADQNSKWEENQKTIRGILDSIQALSRKHDSTIGALGARWGLSAEQSFRNALRGILDDAFGVQTVNVTEYDDEGQVFGRPEQIELDLIIKNGDLIICEIKSSMSRGDMYLFERKARFYEKKHQRTALRLVVISPMVEQKARDVAARLGIQVYSSADEVDPAI